MKNFYTTYLFFSLWSGKLNLSLSKFTFGDRDYTVEQKESSRTPFAFFSLSGKDFVTPSCNTLLFISH